MRREYPFNAQEHGGIDGAVLTSEAFVLRFLTGGLSDRLLIVNLGNELTLLSVPEPLLAPPDGHDWSLDWSSENPLYRGGGISPLVDHGGEWQIPGHAAILLRPAVSASSVPQRQA